MNLFARVLLLLLLLHLVIAVAGCRRRRPPPPIVVLRAIHSQSTLQPLHGCVSSLLFIQNRDSATDPIQCTIPIRATFSTKRFVIDPRNKLAAPINNTVYTAPIGSTAVTIISDNRTKSNTAFDNSSSASEKGKKFKRKKDATDAKKNSKKETASPEDTSNTDENSSDPDNNRKKSETSFPDTSKKPDNSADLLECSTCCDDQYKNTTKTKSNCSMIKTVSVTMSTKPSSAELSHGVKRCRRYNVVDH